MPFSGRKATHKEFLAGFFGSFCPRNELLAFAFPAHPVQTPPMNTRANRISAALTHHFAPTLLEVRDDSHLHAGHAGARAGGETHYGVTMVAASLEGKSRVDRSRAVHAVLAGELANGLHALALTLRTPVEQANLIGR